MPYIKREDRRFVLDTVRPRTAGELNFLFSVIAKEYAERKGIRYDTLNEVMGVFDSAAKEFYRRVVVPYEDQKIQENGDIYGQG